MGAIDPRWLEAIAQRKYVNPVTITSPEDQLALLVCRYQFATTDKKKDIRTAIFREFRGQLATTYFPTAWIMHVKILNCYMHGSTRTEVISFIENGLVT